MNRSESRPCPSCRQGNLETATRVRAFNPKGIEVRVELLTSRCASCGNEFARSAQHDENLARMKARKDNYGGLLLGEEILALRRRYGITQQNAAKLFGKGKIAFSRYENEASYPDETTTKLLTLAIENPQVLRMLAEKAGVDLPLWEARCKDERGQKLRVIADVRKTNANANKWINGVDAGRAQTPLRRWDRDGSERLAMVPATNDDSYALREQFA